MIFVNYVCGKGWFSKHIKNLIKNNSIKKTSNENVQSLSRESTQGVMAALGCQLDYMWN